MKRVIEKLINENKIISTMESCTGGAIANAITNIPNASKVIMFSAVTYSNEFKIKMGVDKELIIPVVKLNVSMLYSMEVAQAMAKAIVDYTNSDYGVGVTGKLKKIDENNPFGEDDLVYLAIYDKNNDKYYNKKIKLDFNNRIDNKNQIINEFIELILKI